MSLSIEGSKKPSVMQLMSLRKLILQTPANAEVRACLQAGMLQSPALVTAWVSLKELQRHQDDLRSGEALPVGSVEYLREAFKVCGVEEPSPFSYPPELTPFLRRAVELTTLGEALSRGHSVFVKPVTTKLFTGFVYQPECNPLELEESDAVSLKEATNLGALLPVWVSEIEQFVSEYRYYCFKNKVVAGTRYDQREEECVPVPHRATVEAAAQAMPAAGPLTLDFGVTLQGETKLIEANDFWAIGLYGKALPPGQYLEWLTYRWREILGLSSDK